MTESAVADLLRGSRWRHRKRGSIAVVLEVGYVEVSFQFPNAVNNPARGMGRWPIALFLKYFEHVAQPTPGILS